MEPMSLGFPVGGGPILVDDKFLSSIVGLNFDIYMRDKYLCYFYVWSIAIAILKT